MSRSDEPFAVLISAAWTGNDELVTCMLRTKSWREGRRSGMFRQIEFAVASLRIKATKGACFGSFVPIVQIRESTTCAESEPYGPANPSSSAIFNDLGVHWATARKPGISICYPLATPGNCGHHAFPIFDCKSQRAVQLLRGFFLKAGQHVGINIKGDAHGGMA
jgi:hypothetical protein